MIMANHISQWEDATRPFRAGVVCGTVLLLQMLIAGLLTGYGGMFVAIAVIAFFTLFEFRFFYGGKIRRHSRCATGTRRTGISSVGGRAPA